MHADPTAAPTSPPTGLPDLATIPAEDRDRVWFEMYYQGDKVPQLTVRAVVVGGLIGMTMSISNLYTTLKLGWAFGVAITACVISYSLWNALVGVGIAKSKMSVLENNAMASAASAAGASTGGTLATAAGAMLLISGDDNRMGWIPLTAWVFFVAVLGVFIAIPMKRQMINQEQLAFPSGIAAAETLRSLYAEGEIAVKKSRALIDSMIVGALVGTGMSLGIIPDEIPFQGSLSVTRLAMLREPLKTSLVTKTEALPLSAMGGMGFSPSVMMIAAGMIVGMRVSLSMMVGATLNYLVIPRIVGGMDDWSELPPPAEGAELGALPDSHYATDADTDKDGLSDKQELLLGSSPTLADSDGDGLTDFMEVKITGVPLAGGGMMVNEVYPNTDGDFWWNDLDGNGVIDGGKWTDINNDGLIEAGEFVGAVWTDANGNGIPDAGEGEVRPRYDLIDPDDDNDRVPTRKELTLDHIERGGVLPDGAIIGFGSAEDGDKDGKIEASEVAAPVVATVGGVSSAIWPRPATAIAKFFGTRDAVDRYTAKDADGDGIPNHLDTDDDNNGIPTIEQTAKQFFGHYEVVRDADGAITLVKITRWSLWLGTSILVFSGLTSFGLGWKTIARAFTSFGKAPSASDEKLAAIEVPVWWMVVGLVPTTIALVILSYLSFSIAPWLGVLSVVLSFALSLVACRATGETDTTPIGAMGKITQLTYAVLAPRNITANLMSAGITAGAAASSADLLTDLKSGYLLGANPRKQFIAQFLGVFFGTASIIPAWFLMVPNKAALEAFNPPATNMWFAVAQALSQGIEVIPMSARVAIAVGGFVGILLPLVENVAPKSRAYLPSAMGLGLAFVVSFTNSLSFFIGSLIAWRWYARDEKSADTYVVPIASGCIAGESLAAAGIAILNTLGVISPP